MRKRYVIALMLAGAAACATATEEDIPLAEQPDGVGNTSGTDGGTGGATGSGGSKSGAGGTMGTPSPAACPDPREPATPGAAQGDSGSFGTLEAVCYFVEGNFNSWNCSNLGGRTIVVNGIPAMMCGGPLPEKVAGGYYFEFGASTSIEYTSFYWYTS